MRYSRPRRSSHRTALDCQPRPANAAPSPNGRKSTSSPMRASLPRLAITILLSVPPAQFPQIAIRAQDKLVLSVMAGVTIAQMTKLDRRRSRHPRHVEPGRRIEPCLYALVCIVRPSRALTATLRARHVRSLRQDRRSFASEDQIDYFTALTGPVPGFVAFFADSMIADAIARGVPKGNRRPRRAPALSRRGRGARLLGEISRRPCRSHDRLCRNHWPPACWPCASRTPQRRSGRGSTPPIAAPRPSHPRRARPIAAAQSSSIYNSEHRKSLPC